MNCNISQASLGRYRRVVSIPNRDFDELQLDDNPDSPDYILVSIPNRDFDELQFSISIGNLPSDIQFQSLIGILMNCNFEIKIYYKASRHVSIPNRDFDELQSYKKRWELPTQ